MPPFATWNHEKQWAFVHLPSGWPNLRSVRFTVNDVTSKHTSLYNCIAYAAKDETQPWWPVPEAMMRQPGARYFHWPVKRVYPATVENFFEAFKTRGYKPCKTEKREFGYEKVAIYVDVNDEIKHMARELGDGVWFSKLGDCQDIRHNALEGVESAGYGQARHFMRKRLKGISRWAMIKRKMLGR
jgi:hypothetical protein